MWRTHRMELNNTDFKYILQDVSTVYLGANYTYQEMMDEDAIPFKLKVIISQSILKDIETDITIAQHLIQMKETSLSHLVYRQLKIKIRANNKVYKFEEFMVNLPQLKSKPDFFIQEIVMSKLSMMALNI